MELVNRLFNDKRLTSVVLITWMTMVLAIFSELGVMDSHFMKFGPGKHSKVMGVDLDSWYKWGCIAVFTFVSTAINSFVGDAIMPWIQNTVQDHKTRFLPYSKFTCIMITQIWTLYCCVMSVFALFVMLSQVDFLLIRICADLLVNVYTSLAFMKGKTVDPERYDAWMKMDGQIHSCFINGPDPNVSIPITSHVATSHDAEKNSKGYCEEPDFHRDGVEREMTAMALLKGTN